MAKENKLEKDVSNKEKIAKALANYVAPFIPFAGVSKRVNQYWKQMGSKMVINSIATASVMGAPIFYGIVSSVNGSIDPAKWPEIQEQRQLKREYFEKKVSQKAFQKYDLDKNNTLDRLEFQKMLQNIDGKYVHSGYHDYYLYLNNHAELGEKYIDKQWRK